MRKKVKEKENDFVKRKGNARKKNANGRKEWRKNKRRMEDKKKMKR